MNEFSVNGSGVILKGGEPWGSLPEGYKATGTIGSWVTIAVTNKETGRLAWLGILDEPGKAGIITFLGYDDEVKHRIVLND